jgi:hypothetical protein
VGLGCGPTLVALTTEQVYGSPESVGFAISTVVVPAALISSAVFLRARREILNRSTTAEPHYAT